MVQLPDSFRRGVLGLTIVWALYALLWIGLEGELRQVMAMGIGAALLLVGYGLQKWTGQRPLPLQTFLRRIVLLSLLGGLLAGPLTVLFMALKTGLHAHGPEFTPQEISWVVQQIPLWSLTGTLMGLGAGLLLAAQSSPTQNQ